MIVLPGRSESGHRIAAPWWFVCLFFLEMGVIIFNCYTSQGSVQAEFLRLVSSVWATLVVLLQVWTWAVTHEAEAVWPLRLLPDNK